MIPILWYPTVSWMLRDWPPRSILTSYLSFALGIVLIFEPNTNSRSHSHQGFSLTISCRQLYLNPGILQNSVQISVINCPPRFETILIGHSNDPNNIIDNEACHLLHSHILMTHNKYWSLTKTTHRNKGSIVPIMVPRERAEIDCNVLPKGPSE